MFSSGDAALPAAGMQAIPRQLRDGLPDGAVRTDARVEKAAPDRVRLESGEELAARRVVVATDGMEAARLCAEVDEPDWNGTTCLYFDAPAPPVAEPVLVLDGDGRGPVNNLCVPSQVTPSYAPAGRSLVSANVVGDSAMDDAALESAVRAQLRSWFGRQVDAWRHLRTYRIPLARPAQNPPTEPPDRVSSRLDGGLFVCGDHRDTGSIQGAMHAGRRAAEQLLAELGR